LCDQSLIAFAFLYESNASLQKVRSAPGLDHLSFPGKSIISGPTMPHVSYSPLTEPSLCCSMLLLRLARKPSIFGSCLEEIVGSSCMKLGLGQSLKGRRTNVVKPSARLLLDRDQIVSCVMLVKLDEVMPECLQGILQMLINLHYSCLIATSVAIVRSCKR